MPAVGKIPGTLPQGQVRVVQQKMNTASIADVQQIIQQQQKPDATSIVAMHPVSQTPGGQGRLLFNDQCVSFVLILSSMIARQ